MKDFAIGGFSFITNGVPTAGFLLQTPIRGLESPKHRTTSFSRPGRDGISVSSKFLDGRQIEIVGQVLIEANEEITTYEARRRALIGAVMNTRDASGNPNPIRITFTTLGGSRYFVDAYFSEPVMPMDDPVNADFLLTAVGNLIYADTTEVSANISRPTGGGFVIPAVIPVITSASTGGTMILTNNGTTETYPWINDDGTGGIKLTGPLTDPIISNLTTGKFIALDYTLDTTDYIQIDMENQLILLNGSSSLNSAMSIDSDWWGLEPGPNSVSISTSSASDTGYFTITYNAAFIGI